MSRDARLFLEDIVACCDKIGRYTLGLVFEQFRKDDKTLDAVARNLELIGEATKRLPEELRKRYQDVPWRRMAGLRDVIVHGYFGIDVQLLWDIVQKDVPAARLKVAAILATEFSSG
ncbi:MAG TPA: DUF86 domain-containing protein [Polyangia bacterium]|nr:DUF86 domain-containing protein [Polyangia bacterium]